jgi:hypothetical protein
MSTEDTVQRLMGLADAFARACFDTDGGAHDARSTLESALREALQVQGLTDAEIERLRAENPVLHDCIESLRADLAERDAEIERLRVDARRYRWLRNRTRGVRDSRGRMEFDMPDPHPLGNIMQGSVAQHLDAAIDAALDQMKDTP